MSTLPEELPNEGAGNVYVLPMAEGATPHEVDIPAIVESAVEEVKKLDKNGPLAPELAMRKAAKIAVEMAVGLRPIHSEDEGEI